MRYYVVMNKNSWERYFDGENWLELFINAEGDKSYYLNNRVHRRDGPAVERANGEKYYIVDGYLHREDGPAIEIFDGSESYYLFGDLYDSLPSPEKIEIIKKEKLIKSIL